MITLNGEEFKINYFPDKTRNIKTPELLYLSNE